MPIDPVFHFRQTRLCIDTPLCIQTVGIFQCGLHADENPGQLRVEIYTLSASSPNIVLIKT